MYKYINALGAYTNPTQPGIPSNDAHIGQFGDLAHSKCRKVICPSYSEANNEGVARMNVVQKARVSVS